MSTDPKPQIIAWALHYDGSGGLKMEVWRKFMLIENYVVLGMTNLDTGAFAWDVTQYEDADAARHHAIVLTGIIENWGCTLTEAPRFREVPCKVGTMRSWLERGSNGTPMAGHEALFDGTMMATSMDPEIADAEWQAMYE